MDVPIYLQEHYSKICPIVNITKRRNLTQWLYVVRRSDCNVDWWLHYPNENRFELIKTEIDVLNLPPSRLVVRFEYQNSSEDPSPCLLVLKAFQHPKTSNILLSGINLNLLDDKDLKRVLEFLPDLVLSEDRYGLLKNQIPTIIKNAYRTYDQTFIVDLRFKIEH